uniref:DDE superfamily endonuclease n=3 Tax=Candidatus Kentrum eta TaxID=2126337 RepID=A0A450VW55_9GAMM|nr:MAG: DDE superfamily endonuclease [Candidatus Kentron sp. H]VFK09048.1 MAG: DDE superfamily endonuclease [Candidatus Kentron sp. H]
MAFLLLSLTKARYQKCMMVQWYAELLGIELLYLPAYSPQFNLIERFRRFVKKEVLYSQYYQDFSEFKSAINRCIEQPDYQQREKFSSLLSWNFQ